VKRKRTVAAVVGLAIVVIGIALALHIGRQGTTQSHVHLLKILHDIPAGDRYPDGALEVSIRTRHFRIPKEYLYLGVKNEWQDGMWIRFQWPSLAPMRSENASRFEEVRVLLVARTDLPRDVTSHDLEKVIVSRHGEPVRLPDYSDVQEYPSRNTLPHYRSLDPSYKWSDGLPSYFYCGGGAVSLGADPKQAHRFQSCTIELTWPDSFMMNIEFNRRNFQHWRAIHEKATALVRSFEFNSDGAGTLIKSSQ